MGGPSSALTSVSVLPGLSEAEGRFSHRPVKEHEQRREHERHHQKRQRGAAAQERAQLRDDAVRGCGRQSKAGGG